MDSSKSHRRTSFERVALVLQGGGALGAYQAGVYQAMVEQNFAVDWIAGTSIGGSTARSSQVMQPGISRASAKNKYATWLVLPGIPARPKTAEVFGACWNR